jgi:hypothetical protein
MRTSRRVAQAFGWIAAGGLLALLVSTNCGTSEQVVQPEACGPNGECPRGNACEVRSNVCLPVPCNDGDASVCGTDTTCFPPTGPGVCTSPEQVACTFIGTADGTSCAPGLCPSGQVCGTIIVNGPGSPSTACGCVPQPVK